MDNSSRGPLPEGVEVPQAFSASDELREWFVAGVSDALDDMPEPEEGGFRDKHAEGSWEAYNSGYQAGMAWKDRDKDWPR